MPQEPRHASIARCVSLEIMRLPLLKSHAVSRMRTRGSSIEATRSRVSSSDFPTLTTTSSHTSSTERIAGTMGKSILTALRTRVKPESMSGPELKVVQAPIQAVGGEQMVVTTPLHDASFRQHDDEVGVLHRREAVRDDEHGAVRHEALDRLLHEPFRFGVERAGRFVENEDRRIAEQRARDGDALALAAAEPRAAFAEHRVVGLGQ